MLLHYATLRPQGPSSIAAIRFSAPVTPSKLRIFPHGERLFENDTSITSTTTEANDLRRIVLFFTATPLPTEAEPKPKARPALIRTELWYGGGICDFPINWGPFSTRLLTVQTAEFESITLAVYGDTVQEPSQSTATPIAQTPEIPIPLQLPPHLDPTRTLQPSTFAKSLWSQTETEANVVPVLHINRLMFCLKARDDDWDVPGYPNLYADVHKLSHLDGIGFSWYQEAIDQLRLPVRDNEELAHIERFANRVQDALGDFSQLNSSQTIYFIGLIAKQSPIFAYTVLRGLPLDTLLTECYDTETHCTYIENFIQFAANPGVSRVLEDQGILESLKAMDQSYDPRLNTLIESLVNRVEGWKELQVALTNPEHSFSSSAKWMKSLTREEVTFSLLLSALELEEPFKSLLRNHNATTNSQVKPFWNHPDMTSTLDERICFVRAFVGIGMAFPVFCWSNSEGLITCLESVLCVFRIWQQTPGYAEILNHLLLIHQCCWRLDRNAADRIPGVTVSAEHLLLNLYRASSNMAYTSALRDFSRKEHTSIPAYEGGWMEHSSYLVQNDLQSAILLIFRKWDPDLSTYIRQDEDQLPAVIRLQRLALEHAILLVEKETDPYLSLAKILSDQDYLESGFIPRLTDILATASTTLQEQYTPYGYPWIFEDLVMDDLWAVAIHSVRLLSILVPRLPPSTRTARQLTIAIARLKLVATFADNSQASTQVNRFLDSTLHHPSIYSAAFQTLLETTLAPFGFNVEEEFQLLSKFIEGLLVAKDANNMSEKPLVVAGVLKHLPLVKSFLQRQTASERARWIVMLDDIDKGKNGLLDYFFAEEWKQLQKSLEGLSVQQTSVSLSTLLHHHIAGHLNVLEELIRQKQEPMLSALTTPSLSTRVAKCYDILTSKDIHIDSAAQIAKELVKSTMKHLRIVGCCSLLRGARSKGRQKSKAVIQLVVNALRSIGPLLHQDIFKVTREAGLTVTAFARKRVGPINSSDIEGIIILLEWVSSQNQQTPIPTLTAASYTQLQEVVAETASSKSSTISSLRKNLLFNEDEPMEDGPLTLRVEPSLSLTLNDLKAIMGQQDIKPPSTPSRKPGQHPALGLVQMSPQATRSPLIPTSSLTKTYVHNEFRNLRSVPSARQNTSRPPSTHVDDFTAGSPPLGSTLSAQNSPALRPVPGFVISPLIKTVPINMAQYPQYPPGTM